MGVRFVLGRAGAGKTHWCFHRIVELLRQSPLGPDIYWILPRQATFQAQRMLACTAGLAGYFRVRAMSFEEFAGEILVQCGGDAATRVSDRGRRMILGHLLRQRAGELRYFRQVAHHPGVAAEMVAAFEELERCGEDPATLAQRMAAGGGEPLPGDLQAKLHDLTAVYSHYAKFLGQERLDPSRRLAAAMSAIRNWPALRDAEIYVDAFYDFPAFQCQMLATLGEVCRSVSICLTMDPDSPVIADAKRRPEELGLFHRTESAYCRARRMLRDAAVKIEEPVLLREPRRFAATELGAMEKWDAPGISVDADTIRMVIAPDARAEVDAAARWILELTGGSRGEYTPGLPLKWQAQGMRFRDIAVLMRDDTIYRDAIESSFSEHGIPFFADRRRSAAHHPLLRLVRAAITVARDAWPHEAITAIIKTDLTGLTPDEADLLENYVLAHGVGEAEWKSAQPWTANRRSTGESDAAPEMVDDAVAVDALRRRLVDRLGPFAAAVTAAPLLPARKFAAAVFRLLEDLNVRQRLVNWMSAATEKSRLEERGEHESVWGEWVEMFDEMVDLFGDEMISLDDFSAILDSALEGFGLALAPPTADQVLVGSVDRTRTPAVRACVVLGLSEGEFPKAMPEAAVFSNADRRAMQLRNIDLEADTTRQLLDERFLGYIAFTRASERLMLTRSALDDSRKPVAPSPFWRHVEEKFPGVKIETVQSGASPENIGTPRQLLGGLMQWIRRGGENDGDENRTWADIYPWLANRPSDADSPVDAVRRQAWLALSYINEAALQPETAAALFPAPLTATARQLEDFAACPFQHFARHGLGLAARPDREVTPADMSWFCRTVLHRVEGLITRMGKTWADCDPEKLSRTIAQQTARQGEEHRDALMVSTARNRYLLGRIERTVDQVAASQREAGRRGDFRMVWSNIRFGEAGAMGPLAIQTPAGNQVLVEGWIDRIDRREDGSACAIAYRFRTGPVNAAEMSHGLELSLVVPLLAMEQNGSRLADAVGPMVPAASLRAQVLRPIERGDPDDVPQPDDPLFHLRHKPRGIVDVRALDGFDRELQTGDSQVVQVFVTKEGKLGRLNQSDAMGSAEFAALLRHVERKIGEWADGVLAGEIGVRPYRIGEKTPCPTCQFRPICRFEPAPGAYRNLLPVARVEMLRQLAEGGG